jgi:O-antigen/teichoic acid export membrane protein
VLTGRISQLHHAGEYREIVRLTIRAIRQLSMFFLPLYAYLLVVSREFIVLLYTPAYAESARIFAINITLIPLTILVLDPILRAFAELRYFLLRLQVVLLALVVISLIIVLPRYGTAGAISVVVGSAVVELVVITWKVVGALGVSRADIGMARDIFMFGVSAAAAAVVSAMLRYGLKGHHPAFVLAVCGIAFLPVYGVCAYACRALTREDIGQMIRAGKRVLRVA